MSLESASYPSQLVATNPAFNDFKQEGDDHIRLIKNVLTITFANVAGVVGLAVNASGNHTWTNSHDFSSATSVSVPAVPISSNSNSAATTSFVQALFTATPASLAWRSRMMFFGGNR